LFVNHFLGKPCPRPGVNGALFAERSKKAGVEDGNGAQIPKIVLKDVFLNL